MPAGAPSELGESPAPSGAALLALLTRFGRLLREAGLPVGAGQIALAARGLARVDVTQPGDVYWALRALLVCDRRHLEVFDRAFESFWRTHGTSAAHDLLARSRFSPRPPPALRRVLEALAAGAARPNERDPEPSEAATLEALGYSALEQLASKDFEQMSAAELALAQRCIAELARIEPLAPGRRFRPDERGARLDLRAMLRASARTFGDALPLRRQSRQERPRPLVVLCDVSGSMERYARVMLHFMHALGARRRRDVFCFVFGTHLVDITRAMRERDVDLALARVGARVLDWRGGTRIGACLDEFNRRFGRRVLGRGAQVLLVSDGLDRDEAAGIAAAMERLHRSCQRLIWLNPLLRYAGFEPRAAGVRAMLPHVDEHRPVHDLVSVFDLVRALQHERPR